MLKKIRVDELKLGMHLHELEGAWLDHPFWKSKFVIRDESDLKKLRDSSIVECWIDDEKGLGVADAPAAPVTVPREPASTAPAQAPTSAAAPPVREPAASMEGEVRRAAQLCQQSRQVVVGLFQEARMGRALDVEHCLPLVGEITASVERNPGAIVSLARLKSHDDYSYMHSVAVCALMVALSRQLGLDDRRTREAGLAGLLHDLGKAVMPLQVLNKPGKLTAGEFDIMKTHPQRGHQMLSEGSAPLAMALDVCLNHHERPDGKGYPNGLSGDDISQYARMGAVCDVYDAITSNRPYKDGWDPADSIAQMAAWTTQGQFDPVIFKAFVQSLGIYPVGSLVRMQSGRLGVVVEQNPGLLVAPKVKLFFSTRSQMPVPVEVLDTSHPGCGDRIVGKESNQVWKFKHLDELWAGAEVVRKVRPNP